MALAEPVWTPAVMVWHTFTTLWKFFSCQLCGGETKCRTGLSSANDIFSIPNFLYRTAQWRRVISTRPPERATAAPARWTVAVGELQPIKPEISKGAPAPEETGSGIVLMARTTPLKRHPQHRHHRPRRCRQDDDDRAHPLLHGPQAHDHRHPRHQGSEDLDDDRLPGAGTEARHHDSVAPRCRRSGATRRSTSSTPPGTWTSPSR